MKKGLITASIVLIGLSLFGIIESSRLERTMQMGIGIGFLPLSMSLVIGVLAVVLLVGVLKGTDRSQGERHLRARGGLAGRDGGPPPDGVHALDRGDRLRAFHISILRRHDLLSSAKGRIVKTLLTSAAFTFFLYAIFRLWLESPLPTGFLGI